MFYFPLLGEMYELVINIYISLLYISSSIKYLIKKLSTDSIKPRKEVLPMADNNKVATTTQVGGGKKTVMETKQVTARTKTVTASKAVTATTKVKETKQVTNTAGKKTVTITKEVTAKTTVTPKTRNAAKKK